MVLNEMHLQRTTDVHYISSLTAQSEWNEQAISCVSGSYFTHSEHNISGSSKIIFRLEENKRNVLARGHIKEILGIIFIITPGIVEVTDHALNGPRDYKHFIWTRYATVTPVCSESQQEVSCDFLGLMNVNWDERCKHQISAGHKHRTLLKDVSSRGLNIARRSKW